MITLVHHYLLQECEQPLTAVKELISNQTGIPISRQVLIITEIEKPVQGLGSVIKKMTCAWQARQGIYSLILSLINFALLPQAVSRYVLAWPVTPSNAFSRQDRVASSFVTPTCFFVLVWLGLVTQHKSTPTSCNAQLVNCYTHMLSSSSNANNDLQTALSTHQHHLLLH